MFNMIRQLIDYAAVRSELATRQNGATLIEYTLIVAVIAVAILVGSQFGLVDAITSLFSQVSGELNGGGGSE